MRDQKVPESIALKDLNYRQRFLRNKRLQFVPCGSNFGMVEDPKRQAFLKDAKLDEGEIQLNKEAAVTEPTHFYQPQYRSVLACKGPPRDKFGSTSSHVTDTARAQRPAYPVAPQTDHYTFREHANVSNKQGRQLLNSERVEVKLRGKERSRTVDHSVLRSANKIMIDEGGNGEKDLGDYLLG